MPDFPTRTRKQAVKAWISEFNQGGSIASADWTTVYSSGTPGADPTITYAGVIASDTVNVSYFDGEYTTDIALISNDAWVYPGLTFDPIDAFGLSEVNLVFNFAASTGDPWSETRLVDFNEVTAQQLLDRIAALEASL